MSAFLQNLTYKNYTQDVAQWHSATKRDLSVRFPLEEIE